MLINLPLIKDILKKLNYLLHRSGQGVVTEDSASVTFTGDGTPDSPLTAEAEGGVAINIYNNDGTIADDRNVFMERNDLTFFDGNITINNRLDALGTSVLVFKEDTGSFTTVGMGFDSNGGGNFVISNDTGGVLFGDPALTYGNIPIRPGNIILGVNGGADAVIRVDPIDGDLLIEPSTQVTQFNGTASVFSLALKDSGNPSVTTNIVFSQNNGSVAFTSGGFPFNFDSMINTVEGITSQGKITGQLGGNFGIVPEYADNAAALAAFLDIGDLYRTEDVLKIVH